MNKKMNINKKTNNKSKKNNNLAHFKLPILIVGITLIVGIAIGVGIMFFTNNTNLSDTNYNASITSPYAGKTPYNSKLNSISVTCTKTDSNKAVLSCKRNYTDLYKTNAIKVNKTSSARNFAYVCPAGFDYLNSSFTKKYTKPITGTSIPTCYGKSNPVLTGGCIYGVEPSSNIASISGSTLTLKKDMKNATIKVHATYTTKYGNTKTASCSVSLSSSNSKDNGSTKQAKITKRKETTKTKKTTNNNKSNKSKNSNKTNTTNNTTIVNNYYVQTTNSSSKKTSTSKKSSSSKKVKPTSITIKDTDRMVEVGKSKKINYTIKPTNATNKNVSFKSSNKKIVTVDSKGNFTGKKVGKAKITVTAKGNTSVKKVVNVEVIKKTAATATTAASTSGITVKSTTTKPATTTDKSDTAISAITVKNASTGASFDVSKSGNTYSATVANGVTKVKVNVVTKNPKSTITKPAGLKKDKVVTWKLDAGKTKTETINVKSENGKKNKNYTIKIKRAAKPTTKSSDATLKSFTIYQTNGYDNTTKTGTTIKTIWDKTFNKNTTSYNIILPSGTKKFEIVAYPTNKGAVITSPSGMVNNQAEHTITNSKKIAITVKAESGATKTYTFNISIQGTTTAAASSSTVNASKNVQIATSTPSSSAPSVQKPTIDYTETIEEEKNTVKKIILNNENLSINKGRSAQAVAIVLPGTVTNREVTWETADENIASVDENGIIYGVNAGTTTIKVKSKESEEITKEIKVTINSADKTGNTTEDKSKIYDINLDGVVNITDYVIAANVYLKNNEYINHEKYPEWKKQLDIINPNGIDFNDVVSISHYILYKE